MPLEPRSGPPVSQPRPLAPRDLAATADPGVSTTWAREDHIHAFDNLLPATGYPEDIALTESDGTATTYARSDHVHAGPGTLGYAEVTADQSGITTIADLTSLSVTVTVRSGRRIKISGEIRALSSVGSDLVGLYIRESTTTLREIPTELSATANRQEDIYGQVILTPSAGSHTYKLSLARIAGTGSVTMKAASTYPAHILVEDIGT